MRYPMILVGVVCLAFILPSCAPPSEQQAEPVAEEAPGNEADVAAIKQAMEDWEEAAEAGDVERVMSLLADAIIYMPPNKPTLTGKQSVREMPQKTFEQYTVDEADFVSIETRVCGNLAFDRGTYIERFTPKAGGESTQKVGKYIGILERQTDGSWKYTRFIWNTDGPSPEKPTP